MYEPYQNKVKLAKLIADAVQAFNHRDAAQLLTPNDRGVAIHERTIVHRLAYYLEQRIRDDGCPPDVAVDCEYNRFGLRRKYLTEMESFRTIIEAADRSLTVRGELSILPDIIVHERGKRGSNYLVIEVKKDSNATTEAVTLDHTKLGRLTDSGGEFNYVLGVEVRARDGREAIRKLEILSMWLR